MHYLEQKINREGTYVQGTSYDNVVYSIQYKTTLRSGRTPIGWKQYFLDNIIMTSGPFPDMRCDYSTVQYCTSRSITVLYCTAIIYIIPWRINCDN